jgi:acetyl-CoA carboxylase biotin carboxyl carrier protein
MSNSFEVLSPLPGTFYRSAAPGTPPFKVEGDSVAVGDVLGMVEVMKQFSEVTAEAAGRLVRFAVDNEAPVEPGQLLADIAPL